MTGNNPQKIKILIVLTSCVLMGGLGVYYFYLKGTGGISPFKAALISGIGSFLGCLMFLMVYFYEKEKFKKVFDEPQYLKAKRDFRGLIFIIFIFGLVFAFSLFFILRQLLKF